VTTKGGWTPIHLSSHTIALAWQAAVNGNSDGYLRVAMGDVSIDLDRRSESARLVRLRTTLRDGMPWLTLIDD
jgi:hypothetical protein